MPPTSWIDVQLRPAWYAIRLRGDFSVLEAILRGGLDLGYTAGSNRHHLAVAMEWLCQAQDASPDGGVAAAFDLAAHRWYPSYPETTGYIIPTFFDYAAFSGEETYRLRALRMAEWLLTLQMEDGAFPGPPWIQPAGGAVVFDTGQIIHGLVRAYEESMEARFLEAACRAGDWLAKVQEADGSWKKFDLGQAHAYNTRTAWALLCLDQAAQSSQHHTAAIKNLEWVLSQQGEDGWFCCAAFEPKDDPLTHTLAYTIEGLLEAGKLLNEPLWTEAARLGADALRGWQAREGALRGTYGPGWRPGAKWSCLTGEAQMALVWMQLYKMTGDGGYTEAAGRSILQVKKAQSRAARMAEMRGGVSGSSPIYGEYGRYLYLNWAAKFFADCLMMSEGLLAAPPLYQGVSPYG